MDQSSGNTGGGVANNPSAGLIVAYVCLGAGAILLVIAIIVILYLTCKGKLYKRKKVQRDEVVLVEDVNGNPAVPVARSVVVSEKRAPVSVITNSLPRHAHTAHAHAYSRTLDTTDSRPVVVRTLPRGSTIMSVKSEAPYRVKRLHSVEKRKYGKGKAMSVQSLPRSRSLKDIQGESMLVPVRTVYKTTKPAKAKHRHHRNGPAHIYSSAPALYTLPRGNRLVHMDKGAQHHVTRWLYSHPHQPKKPASVAAGGVTMATGRPYVYSNPIYASSDPGEDLDHTLDHVDSSDVKMDDVSYDTHSLFLRWSPNMRRKRDDSSGIYSTSQRSFDIGSHTLSRVPGYHGSKPYLANGNIHLESL